MLKLFLLCSLVLIQPADDFIALVKNLLFVLIIDLALKFLIFHSCFHVEGIGLREFLEETLSLCFSSSALYFSASCTMRSISSLLITLAIGDGDLVFLSCALIYSRNIEDAIGIDVKSNLNLRDPTGCWRDACELELSKQVVVLGSCASPTGQEE